MRFTKTTQANKRTACLYLAIRRAVALAVTNLILAICFTTTADEDFYSASNDTTLGKDATVGKTMSVDTTQPTVSTPRKQSEKELPDPVAIPVATEEEAKKYDKIAFDYLKGIEEQKLKDEERKKILRSKAELISQEEFKVYNPIGDYLKSNSDLSIASKGYNLQDFRRRLLPSSWRDMDVGTLPSDAFFGKEDDGFRIVSPKGKIRFHLHSSSFNSMNSSFFFEVEIKNNSSNSNCKVDLGFLCYGNNNSGYVTDCEKDIPAGETRKIFWETDPYEGYYQIRPTMAIQGDATIKEFRICRYVHSEITIVEGTVKDRSQLPPPNTTDYPDCSYTAHFVGNSILDGLPCNKELELTIDGFINKKVLGSNNLKKGDNIRCAIVKFDQLPEIKSSGTQVADDLSLFELDSYLLLSYQKINFFTNPLEHRIETIDFADSGQTKQKYVSIFDNIFNDKMNEEAKQAQKDSISHELKRITEMLAPYTDEVKKELNTRFQEAWTKEKQKDPQGYNRIKDIVWRNMDNAFYALPEQYTFISEESPNPISPLSVDALVALKEYLELQGIQFIVSLVPDYYAIAARVINKEFASVPDFGTAYTAKQLLENGIETIYASDEIIRNYNKYSIPYIYPEDGHPADLPQDVLSSIIADRISRFHLKRELIAKDFSVVVGDYGPGYWGSMLYPQKCDIGDNPENSHYKYTMVLYQNKMPNNNQDSPILLMGNSYSYSPTTQTLMSFLAMKTGFEIYQFTFGSGGVFTTAIQRFFNTPEHYLKNKKVVVLQVGTNHFLSFPSILNIKKIDDAMKITKKGKLIKTIELTSNESTVPEFARELSNPFVYRIGQEKKTLIFESKNVMGLINNDLLSPKGKYYVEINYCCRRASNLSLVINSNKYHLQDGNSISLWLKEVYPLSLDSNNLTIEVHGDSGNYIAIGSIKIYQLEE